jgi:hypothetical protein
VVAEALLEVDVLAAGRGRQARGGQVVVDAPGNLQTSSHTNQSFTATPRPRLIHDRRQTALKQSPTFTLRSGADGQLPVRGPSGSEHPDSQLAIDVLRWQRALTVRIDARRGWPGPGDLSACSIWTWSMTRAAGAGQGSCRRRFGSG